MGLTKIYLICHGMFDGQPDTPYYIGKNYSDVGLSEEGKVQIALLGQYFQDCKVKVDNIICTTNKHDLESAFIIGDIFGVNKCQISVEEKLVELNADELTLFKSDKDAAILSGSNRICNWFDSFAIDSSYDEKTVIIVTHREPILQIIAHISSTDLICHEITNASFTYISREESNMVSCHAINCTEHLKLFA